MGFCGIFKHFSGFGLCLLPNRIHARPHAGNANRWACRSVENLNHGGLAGNCFSPTFSVLGFSFFKLAYFACKSICSYRPLLFNFSFCGFSLQASIFRRFWFACILDKVFRSCCRCLLVIFVKAFASSLLHLA